MKKISQSKLGFILDQHYKWLESRHEVGQCADLSNTDLRSVDLSCRNLSNANFSGANLSRANLRSTRLKGANLSGAHLVDAVLCRANLWCANLNGACLHGANLFEANLSGADLSNVSVMNDTAFYPMQCPESGAFIGYKRVAGFIVKLEICADALRSSATSRKCRCSKAKVLSIETIDGQPSDLDMIESSYDPDFVYKVGEIAEVPYFDRDRWIECAPGIHFFITRDEAVRYIIG